MKAWMIYALLPVAIAFSLLARFFDPFSGDVYVLSWIQDWQNPVTTDFMGAISQLGVSWLIYAIAVTTTLVLFILHRRRESFIALVTLVILSLAPLLKWLIDRPRPSADVYSLADSFTGLGFPSGHAFQSFVLFGFLFYLTSLYIGRIWLRRVTQVFLILLVLAIGVSRIYLGAHWPSDVLGAYLLGGSCMGFLLLWNYRSTKRPIGTS